MYVVSTRPSELFAFQAHGDTAERFWLSNFLPTLSMAEDVELSAVALQKELAGQVLIHDACVRTTSIRLWVTLLVQVTVLFPLVFLLLGL